MAVGEVSCVGRLPSICRLNPWPWVLSHLPIVHVIRTGTSKVIENQFRNDILSIVGKINIGNCNLLGKQETSKKRERGRERDTHTEARLSRLNLGKDFKLNSHFSLKSDLKLRPFHT
jgi:hypothetical protein